MKLHDISMRTLDDVLQNDVKDLNSIDLLKIDIEGSECIALYQGGRTMFKKYKPTLVMTEALVGAMRGCDVQSYIDSFVEQGYKISREDFPPSKPNSDYYMRLIKKPKKKKKTLIHK